jgi:hypothetical protein
LLLKKIAKVTNDERKVISKLLLLNIVVDVLAKENNRNEAFQTTPFFKTFLR